jgi:hypothetical protein
VNENMRVDYVTPNDMFWQILSAHRREPVPQIQTHFADKCMVALDPGETTGVAVWEGSLDRIELFQLETKNIGQSYDMLDEILGHYKPCRLRCEDYRIYQWMADQHSWSILHTPQLIGAIKVLAHKRGLDLTFKLAQHAKAMWTDDNLKLCTLYSAGMKHARDAKRHLLFQMAKPTETD